VLPDDRKAPQCSDTSSRKSKKESQHHGPNFYGSNLQDSGYPGRNLAALSVLIGLRSNPILTLYKMKLLHEHKALLHKLYTKIPFPALASYLVIVGMWWRCGVVKCSGSSLIV
jgi:hypothetical protein